MAVQEVGCADAADGAVRRVSKNSTVERLVPAKSLRGSGLAPVYRNRAVSGRWRKNETRTGGGPARASVSASAET